MKIIAIIIAALMLLTCCQFSDKDIIPEGEELGREYYQINMDNDYKINDPLESVPEGTEARVIILIGQSNATGCSLTSYLKDGVGEEKYAEFEAGYNNVLINFCLDNHSYSSDGSFLPVGISSAAGEGCFGPELGMAELISEAFPDEKIFILKFTMSGYSLNYHWLYDYSPSYIYNSFKIFAQTYLEYLSSKGYSPSLDAICWMQGESDTTDYKAGKYYDNTVAVVENLRFDFAAYAPDRGIYFIDAGISDSPYCEPAYPEINEAKKRFSFDSPLNIYFSTIDAGLTTRHEPKDDPDLGHYDAMSELELGRMFGREILKIYSN